MMKAGHHKRETFLQYLMKRLLPPFFRAWQGAAAVIIFALLAAAISLFPRVFGINDTFWDASSEIRYIQVLFILMTLPAMFLKLNYDYQRRRSSIDEHEEKLGDAVKELSEKQESLGSVVRAQLRVVIERASLLMANAQARANALHSIGTIFTLASVMAPLFAISVYVTQEPLSGSLYSRLVDLHNLDGQFPAGLELSTGRDWHVLLAGMSFGFLFLAAAAALFAQHRRQVEMTFRLSEDVDYFNRVIAAVEIVSRPSNDQENISDALAKVVGIVVLELLRREGPRGAQDQQDGSTPGQSDNIKQVLDLIRSP